MSFKSGFESRERERERESQFNTASGSEFQVRGKAVLSGCLIGPWPSDVFAFSLSKRGLKCSPISNSAFFFTDFSVSQISHSWDNRPCCSIYMKKQVRSPQNVIIIIIIIYL